MLRMLACAIKAVYASVFYRDSKAYMLATSNVIDQEKMAVVLQQVVGKQYDGRFYPNISGVIRSINYYPVGNEKAEEGVVSLALGLGKHIVEGGQSIRLSPYHPKNVMQMSELHTALRQTQTDFYAIDTRHIGEDFKVDDGFNILKLGVREAEKDHALHFIASTYDPQDNVIRDGLWEGGRKIISFAGVLQQRVFPLPKLMQLSMQLGADAMKRPVEIEFACNLNADRTGEMYLLQIRPIVEENQAVVENLSQIADDQCLLRTDMALGHGESHEVRDVVYVKTSEGYNPLENKEVAQEVETFNRQFADDGERYVLIGPGRWGSSDPGLGIPVKWSSISAASVIVELGIEGYQIDASQGTHFFQNLTSFGVGYFTINAWRGEGICRTDWLDALPAVEETKHVRHVRFPHAFRILIDGQKQRGLVALDEADLPKPE